MAKDVELRCAGPEDPIYREGTTMLSGGLWGRKGQPLSGTPSQPTSNGDPRQDPNRPADEAEPQSADE